MNRMIVPETNLHVTRTKQGFLMLLLSLYVFFLYTAQETLLPTKIHSVIMYCFVACTLVYSYLKNGGKVLVTSYSMWYILLLIFSFVSLLWATEPAISSIYNMVVSFVITFCFITVLDTNEKLDLCVKVFVLSADIMGVLLILTGQLSFDFNSERLGESVTGNANIFSSLMMIAAVFAIWVMFYKTNKKLDKMLYFASYLFILAMMAISGGRKTIVAVIACTIFFIIFKNGTKSFKILKNMLLAVAFVIIIYNVVMKVPLFYEFVGQRFEELFKIFSGGTSAVHSDRTREIMVGLALDRWQERPLFGYGIDTFKYYNREVTGYFYYAHNNYVEILYDFGIVGFFMYYGYLFTLGYSLMKTKQNNIEYKVLGLALLIEVLVFDFGGVSYCTNTIQIVLSLAYLCGRFCVRGT